VTTPGTFAHSALMARRLAERGVRCIEIFHREWDHHTDLTRDLPLQCRDVDQACSGLITDLKNRGMLDETLVVWGGEFGRTVYCQGKLTKDNYGRDHHPRCFTMWMAGGGSRPGTIYGETDDFSYNITKNPVHIHDFHATVLNLLGFDHEKFTFRYQGLDQRLTGVEKANVIKDLIV
jgi:arylsulfatase A-like enzyme